MSDNAEYDKLLDEKSRRQREYNACSSRIDDCNYLIERLRAARDTVSDLKDQFKNEVRYNDKGVKNDEPEWTGSTHTTYLSKMESLVTINESYYDDTLDYVLDSLNTEITRIKNIKNDELGVLGWLGDRINNLGNMIENFFN